MTATVTRVIDGIADVRIRRGNDSTLYGRHYDLKQGDTVTVKRQANNPYLVRILETR